MEERVTQGIVESTSPSANNADGQAQSDTSQDNFTVQAPAIT